MRPFQPIIIAVLLVVGALTMPCGVVHAQTTQWQQIAGAPHVLSAVQVMKRDAARLFEIEPEGWTQWHIPAPGNLALHLPNGEDVHKALDVYHSNGSGLLVPARFTYNDTSRLWVLSDVNYGHRIVHVRAREHRIALEAFFLTVEAPAYRTLQDIRSAEARRKQVREHLLKLGQSFFALEPQREEQFDVRGQRVVRLKLRAPFSSLPRSWQDLRLRIKADGQTIDTPALRLFQDRRRPWFVDGQTTLLSKAEDYLVELPPGARQLSLAATHHLLVRIEAVQREPYLFPTWNEASERQQASENNAISAAFGRQDMWREITGLVQDNLISAAPLHAIQMLDTTAADPSVQRFVSSIWSRYTDLLDLLPAAARTDNAFKAKYLEYRGARLLHPNESRARRWLSSAQLSSAANKAPGAWFVMVGAGQTIDVPAPVLPFTSRLRVITERIGAQPLTTAGTQISVQFAPGYTQRLLLDSNQAAPARHDPAHTGSWSQGLQRLTPEHAAYAEVSLPRGTSNVRLTNNGGSAVWIALQQRVPRKHRHSESDWAWLMMERAASLPDLWQQAWRAGLTTAGGWRAKQAQDLLRQQPVWEIINGWLPSLHYLGEQHAQFRARATAIVPNPDCTGASADRTSVRPARHWEQRKQWINAAEQWRAALPRLQGARCAEAHQALTEDLLRIGAHHLAETYQQTLVKQSSSKAVREKAVRWLLDYYKREQIPHRAVQLAAYVASTEPTPEHLLNLVHALFDAGQEQTGLDLALATPALHADQRVWATLFKHGWTSVYTQLRDQSHGPGFDPAAFAQLKTSRTSALEHLIFSDSVMIHDHLLGESSPQLKAKPEAPVSFAVQGPARLRISMRPFAHADEQPAQKAWAMVSVNSQKLPQPLSLQNNIARYHTADNERMGGLTQTELTLGEGAHRISIAAPNFPIAVALHKRSLWHTALNETLQMTDQRVSVLADSLGKDRVPTMSEGASSDNQALYPLPETQADRVKLLAATPADADAGRQLMRTLSYMAESQPNAAGYLQRAEWWASRVAIDRSTVALRNRLRGGSRWRPVEIAQNHTGIYVHELDRFNPESEHWRLRNLFLPAWQPGENLLGGGQQLNLAFEVGHPTALRIDAEHLTLPGLSTQTMQLTIDHQGQDRTSSLAPNGPPGATILELDPGTHQVVITARGSSKSSVLKVTLAQLINDEWQTMTRTLRRRFFVAGVDQAVEPGVRGPAWLRIDHLDGAQTVSRYQYLAAGEDLESLEAISAAPTYYRILIREPDDNGDVLPLASQITPTATSWRSQTSAVAAPGLTWHSTQATALASSGISRHDAPTYSLTNAWHADNDAREDGRFPVEDFFETVISRRKRDATGRNFDETNLYLRQRNDGDSIGASYYHWRAFEDAPLTVRGDARLFAQRLEDHWHWSAQARLALRHRMQATARRRHTSEISAFARYVSEDNGSAAYDPDVYTAYRRDHLDGVQAKHTVYWQTHEDAEWYGGISVRSNELSQASLDHVRMRWGNRLQLDHIQLGAEYQLTHYFSDEDRNNWLRVPRLKVRGRWYGKPTARGRLELSSEVRYDFDIHRTSGLLRLTWHFDRDQALNDLHGERYWLDDLLERQLNRREQP